MTTVSSSLFQSATVLTKNELLYWSVLLPGILKPGVLRISCLAIVDVVRMATIEGGWVDSSAVFVCWYQEVLCGPTRAVAFCAPQWWLLLCEPTGLAACAVYNSSRQEAVSFFVGLNVHRAHFRFVIVMGRAMDIHIHHGCEFLLLQLLLYVHRDRKKYQGREAQDNHLDFHRAPEL